MFHDLLFDIIIFVSQTYRGACEEAYLLIKFMEIHFKCQFRQDRPFPWNIRYHVHSLNQSAERRMNKVKFCTFLNIIDFNKPHTGWTPIPSTPGSMPYQISANSIEVFEKYEFLMDLL